METKDQKGLGDTMSCDRELRCYDGDLAAAGERRER